MADVTVELKICEACGCLFLRRCGEGVYCTRCVRVLSGTWVWRPGVAAEPAPRPGKWARLYRRQVRKLLQRYRQGRMCVAVMQDWAETIGFCIDVERCLARLSEGQWFLIKRIGLQGQRHKAVASATRTPMGTLVKRFERALDALGTMFLQLGLMRALPGMA